MVPNINNRGQSFKGVTAYLMHDKGAATSERVAWSETYNMHTQDVEKASRYMAFTDLARDEIKRQHEEEIAAQEGREPNFSNAGRPAEAGNVYHYSLAWHPAQQPTREEMTQAALESVERLGLAGHQFYVVAHDDEEHSHVHVVANLVNPETGQIANVYKDHNTLDRWSHEYEKEHGIVCEDRDKKYQAWEQDERAFDDKKIGAEAYGGYVTKLYRSSDSASAFQAGLAEQDLTLAQGKHRSFVLVDRDGEVFNLNKLIEPDNGQSSRVFGKKVSEFLNAGLVRDQLPQADDVSNDRKHYDRDAAETQAQHDFAEAADQAAAAKIAAEDLSEKLAAKKEAMEAELEAQRQVKEDEIAEAQRAVIEQASAAQRQQFFAAYEEKLEQRVEHWREYWQIDKLQQQRDEAAQHFKNHSGWFYRYIFRGKYQEAEGKLWAADKTLEHALSNWRDDIKAIYDNRPQWVIDRELAKRGFGDSGINAGDGQERTTVEAQQAKDTRENQTLREAESSPQAAARLGNVVSGKTVSDRGKAASVKVQAERVKSDEIEQTQAKEQAEQQQQPLTPDSVEEQLAQDMRRQREEMERDEIEQDMDYADAPEFDSEEERQVWEDMRRQREEMGQDRDGIDYE